MTEIQTTPVSRVAKFAFFALAVTGVVCAETQKPRVDLASEPFVRPARHIHGCQEGLMPQVRVDSGHHWRPPFGIDRVGALPLVQVALSTDRAPRGHYAIAAYRAGDELERKPLQFKQNPSWGSAPNSQPRFFGSLQLTAIPDEVALLVQCAPEEPIQEVHRQRIDWPIFEADARARPGRQINPVDLGAILVPHNWLLLSGGHSAVIDVAAISRNAALPNARLRVWFDGGKPVETAIALEPHRRSMRQVRVPLTAKNDTSTLHVVIVDGDRELWHKEIHTMVVSKPAPLPAFGVVQTKLRYEAPIAVGRSKTGKSQPPLDYATAWDPKFNDVVVALPNGSRFVFWRGASYIPFWAGKHNTGLTYQWAEGLYLQAPNAEGGTEMPEALNDKELRYSSVRLLESTASRVHVRWTYQATDIAYRTWGDQLVEDYYFYPDGLGTRVVTLTAVPEARYELSEFISVIPQAVYPFEVLPEKVIELLYLDGERRTLNLPLGRNWDEAHAALVSLKQGPAVYRIYQDRHDPVPAIYFSPTQPPPSPSMMLVKVLGPFYEQAQQVTPAYWGDHWPLSRGKLTRYYIHDGLFTGPSHNSFMGFTRREGEHWVEGNPEPISTSGMITIDALGRVRPMRERRWVWLIGKSEASEGQLRTWAESFSVPPAVQVRGARLNAPAYVQERRAIRLVVESPSVEIHLKPATHTMNPVFELDGAPKTLTRVAIDGRVLTPADFAWDGATLWVRATIEADGARLDVQF